MKIINFNLIHRITWQLFCLNFIFLLTRDCILSNLSFPTEYTVLIIVSIMCFFVFHVFLFRKKYYMCEKGLTIIQGLGVLWYEKEVKRKEYLWEDVTSVTHNGMYLGPFGGYIFAFVSSPSSITINPFFFNFTEKHRLFIESHVPTKDLALGGVNKKFRPYFTYLFMYLLYGWVLYTFTTGLYIPVIIGLIKKVIGAL